MRRSEFIHQVTIALARKRDTATASGLATYARLLACELEMAAPFDERDPDELPSPDPAFLARVDGLAKWKTAAMETISALSKENDRLKGENEGLRKQIAALADEAQEARTMSAHILREIGGQRTVTVETMDMVSGTPWEISTKRLAAPGGITQGVAYTFRFRPEVQVPARPAR